MRTDGVQLAQEIVEGARAYVSQQYGAEYLPEQPRVYKCVGSNSLLTQSGGACCMASRVLAADQGIQEACMVLAVLGCRPAAKMICW